MLATCVKWLYKIILFIPHFVTITFVNKCRNFLPNPPKKTNLKKPKAIQLVNIHKQKESPN